MVRGTVDTNRGRNFCQSRDIPDIAGSRLGGVVPGFHDWINADLSLAVLVMLVSEASVAIDRVNVLETVEGYLRELMSVSEL
jgi:hypothetical protein